MQVYSRSVIWSAWRMAVLVVLLLKMSEGFADEWKSAAPIPKGAEEVYGIAAGGKLYVFGGLGLAGRRWVW
jgi:hypothetical protein